MKTANKANANLFVSIIVIQLKVFLWNGNLCHGIVASDLNLKVAKRELSYSIGG
jgi:hypothetical protein